MTHSITLFFAHASRNKPLLREIKAKLPDYLSAWIDEYEIIPGTNISKAIEDAIERSADFFIPFIDEESLNSKWVQTELSAAELRSLRSRRVFTIPIILEPGVISRCPKWIQDLKHITLHDFSAVSSDRMAEELIKTIHSYIAMEFAKEKREENPSPWATQLIQFNQEDEVSRFRPIRAGVDKSVAGEVVRIIAITGFGLLTPVLMAGQRPYFVNALKRGVVLKMVVMNPDSPQAIERAKVETPLLPPEESLLRIDGEKVWQWYKSSRGHAVWVDNLELRRSSSLFSFALVMLPHVAFIEPYHLGKISDVPHLCGFSIIQAPHGSHDYEVAERHFDYMFLHGTAAQ